MNISEVSSYLVYGAITGRISPAWLIEAFDHISYFKFFCEPDNAIMQYVLEHGDIADRPAFHAYIGDTGLQRVRDIQALVLSVQIGENGAALGWCLEVKRDWQKRMAMAELEQTALRLRHSEQPIYELEVLQDALGFILNSSDVSDLQDGYDAAQQAHELVDGLYSGLAFVKTGIEVLDHDGGLERNMGGDPKINGLAGTPGSGKTAIAGQVGYYAASQGLKVVIIENEMSNGSVMLRQAIQNTGITRKQMRENKADPRIIKAEIEDLKTLPIRYLSKPGIETLALLTQLNKAAHELGGIDLVIVDHTATLSPSDKRINIDSPQYLNQIYRDLKNKIVPNFKGAAWLCLQHLNMNMFRVSGDSLTPTLDDFQYQTGHIFNQAYINILYSQHGKQLEAYSRETIQGLWKSNPKEAKEREQTAFIHCVKNREGAASIYYRYRYEGHIFKWSKWEKGS